MATSAGVRAGKAFISIEAIDRTQIVLDKVAQRLTKFQNKLREIGQFALKLAAAGSVPGILSVREFANFEQAIPYRRPAEELELPL